MSRGGGELPNADPARIPARIVRVQCECGGRGRGEDEEGWAEFLPHSFNWVLPRKIVSLAVFQSRQQRSRDGHCGNIVGHRAISFLLRLVLVGLIRSTTGAGLEAGGRERRKATD